MKNKIYTILVAIALAITFTGNIDAKYIGKRPQVTPHTASKPIVPILPVEKEKTEEELIEDAKEVLLTIPETRSHMGDIFTGYTDKDKEDAEYYLNRLATQEKIISTLIEEKKKEIATVATPGRLWGYYPKPGKEEEYEEINKELQELQNILTQIHKHIRDQSVILGKEWSKKYIATVGSTVTIITLAAGTYMVGVPALKAGLTQFKEAPMGSIKAGYGIVSTNLGNYWKNFSLKKTLGYGATAAGTNVSTSTIAPKGSGTLLGTAGTLAAGFAVDRAKAYAQAALEQKALDTLMSYIEDPDVDPSAKKDYMQQAKAQAMQLEQSNKRIADMEMKLEEQIAQQRNLKPQIK